VQVVGETAAAASTASSVTAPVTVHGSVAAMVAFVVGLLPSREVCHRIKHTNRGKRNESRYSLAIHIRGSWLLRCLVDLGGNASVDVV
jgi:hypothetical protein